MYSFGSSVQKYYQRRSRMGGRSEGEGDVIAFIHATDASSWAIFLQNKLRSDSYKIQSYLHHEPNENYIPELVSTMRTCAVLVSPMLLEPQYSVFWSRCAERFNHRTVLLFLGVNEEEIKLNLGTSVGECVLSHQWLAVDGSQRAVSSALVKLIEVFESDSSYLHILHEGGEPQGESEDIFHCPQSECEDIYDYPPRPRQQNAIVRVVPEVLYENDSHEVLVVMEREADGVLTMVTESHCGPSRHITMKRVVSSVYSATIPEDLVGKVDFMLLSEDEHNLGNGSFRVLSAMDQLHYLLEKETSPLTVLCRAQGLLSPGMSETEKFDSMLARRLAFSQFPAGLSNVLYPNDQLMGEQCTSQWPSLLHFAAEFNLTKVCEELLRYPGIIHAACTENCDGLFPCQLAERNGFTALQKRLVRYVEDMRQDSGISFSENLPAPSPHSSHGHLYVNEKPPPADLFGATDDDEYIDMSRVKFSCQGALSACQEMVEGKVEGDSPQKPAPSPCWRKVNDGYAKPRSFSEGCVKTPYAKTPSEARIAEEEAGDNDPPPLKPKMGRTRSAASACMAPTYLLSKEPRPDSSSSESSDNQEAPQEGSSTKSSTETLTHSESAATSGSESRSEEIAEEVAARVAWSVGSMEDRPASQMSNASSQSDYEVPPGQADASPEDLPVLRGKNSKRSKTVQDKISLFFKKITHSRKPHCSSDSDLPAKGTKKSVVYSRQSTSSTSSDPSGYTSSTLRSKGGEGERDSGAVCDDHGSQQRRVSVRVLRAKNEDLSETPILPARKSSAEAKETFVSFIK